MLTLSESHQNILFSLPMFMDVENAVVLELLEGATFNHYPSGCLLFSYGDASDRLFVVLDGRVNLFAANEAGKQSIIKVVPAGDTIGLGALFCHRPFPLNATAVAGTSLLVVLAAPFLRRLAERPLVVRKMLAGSARTLIRMERELADYKRRSPIQRVGSFLFDRLRAAGPDAVEFRLDISKGELAGRIGIERATLSRAFARLRAVGVSVRGRSVTVTDPDSLRRFCREEWE